MAGRSVPLDICKSWERTGKSDFVKLCRSAASCMQTSRLPFDKGGKEMQLLLHDLCWHVLEDRLKVEQAVSALAEVTALHQELPSMLADVIFLLDMETLSVENRDQRDRFYWLVGGCAKVVPDSLLKERLDIETLGDGGIVKNSRVMLTKFVKIKTRLFYKQNKYNLFREESEGYAKLTTELSQEITSKISPDYMIEVMRSLIGCFNLDPNRVLDVVLEAFECRLHLEDFFVPLLTKFLRNPATISQVLGFKFTFYQGEAGEPTPASLYRLAALLIRNELIALDDLYSLLLPDDGALSRQHKKEVAAAKTYARRATVVVVSSDKKDEEKKEEDKDDDLTLEENQKLGLCEALLEVGDWPNAQKLMARLPEHYAVSQPHIARRLCLLVHTLVEPLYRRHSGLPEGFRRSYASSRRGGLRPPVLVETFGDFQARALPMLVALGPMLHLDPVLIVKVVRLARAHLHKASSSAGGDLRFDLLTLVGESLLPSLSLLDCNCCVADEIWSLLKLYPYQQRYRLYSQWKNEAYVSHPLLIRVKADSLKRIKYIMKRLSKENVKPSGRQIGKLSHSNPCFLFDYILSQIQTWDNLIVPVVDSLKYLTMLSYDVLAYCVAEALCNPEKDRMKHDGTSISLWLQSLASFCGAVFKKYSIDLTGLLQLVANQLKAEKSLDLLVLKDIVQKMTGIESTEQATQDQLEAMCGGELLKAEGGYFHQLRNTKKSSQRLKEALLEQDLALPLCLLMAQQKNCILYRDQEASHLKLVGKLYDQCQDTLVQFGSFLSSSLSTEEYAGRLPPVDQLLSRFHVQADVAFFLARPMFGHSIALKFDDAKRRDKTFKSLTAAQKLQRYVDAVDQVMSRVVESVRPLHPSKTWEDLSPQFYVTFWSLSMYDLHVPTSSYEREVGKLKQQVVQAEDSKDMVPSKRKKERDRCEALMEKLQEEERKQQDHCGRVLARLRSEKDAWFHSRSAKNETITQFLQLCVFPRCTFTALDALYCAKFVHLIHILKTPNFSTLICYDKIFCDITYTVTACTENEANRYGRFLCSMLETVMRWHSDKAIFDKECANFPGFMTKFRGASQSSDIATDHVDYENYRHVCHKWHFKITKALVICLESGDYVQIRNSLIVLTKVLPHFPVMTNLGQALERRIEKIRQEEKEKRPDLFALATGYAGQLKGKKSELIPEHEFHLKDSKDGRAVSATAQAKNAADHTVTTAARAATSSQVASVDGAKEKRGDSVRESNSSPALSGNSSGKLSSSGGGLVQSSSSSSSSKMTSSSSSSATRRESSSFGAVVESATTAAFPRRSLSKESGSGDGHDKGAATDRKGSSLSSLHEQDVRPSKEDVHKNDHWLEPGDAPGDHKRRRVDGGSSSGGSSSGKVGGSPRGRSLGGTQSPKVSEPEGKSEDRGGGGDRPSEKWAHPKDSHDPATGDKGKAKKGSRKRDHSDEPPLEGKRKKDEDALKSSSKRNGEDSKEKERYRRVREQQPLLLGLPRDQLVALSPQEEDKLRESPKLRERRADRDDKKHHRSSSSSGSSTSTKKRSSF
ncbi:THO complex subunit 2 isoform X5 [Ixodes scapularis]|uniref:THO complex subunit 2 isoform X5 n=1 Tax=Ixodes scapularis TaxID=6945 RepID=UPI001A9FC25C|nr:THO complex subunit 2 isoform X5 [Ixodes scapularis]